MDPPTCLVRQNGPLLELTDDGVAKLRSFDNRPIAVITVAGLYRTGKSFFLNQLAGTSGFKVGNTVESCTRGIWMWTVPSDRWSHPQHPNAQLVLLDTEGLASMDNDENYDARIFSLGILLSSFFVYNSMGVIDESAIDRLFLVGELTKNVCISVDDQHEQDKPRTNGEAPAPSEQRLADFFPPFLWLLRDFSLELAKDGRPITEREYLEQALEERPGSSSRVQDRNQICRSFKTLFSERTCATLVRPVHEESQLRQLSSLDRSQYRPEFLAQLDAVTNYVLDRAHPKMLFGKPIHGVMLASLAHAYVAAINGGAIPDIKKGYEYMVEDSFRGAFEGAVRSYSDTITSVVGKRPFPSRDQFDQAHNAALDHSLLLFTEKTSVGTGIGSVGSPAQRHAWLQKLNAEVSQVHASALQTLRRESLVHCQKVADSLHARLVQEPVEQGTFDSNPSLFVESIQQLLAAFDERASGPGKDVAVAHVMVKTWIASLTHVLQRNARVHQDQVQKHVNEFTLEQEHRKRLQVQLEGTNAQLEMTRTENEKLEAHVDALSTKLQKTEDQLQSTASALEATRLEATVTRKELDDTKATLDKEVAMAQATEARLKLDLEALQTSNGQLKLQLEAYKDNMHLLERKNDRLERDLEEETRTHQRDTETRDQRIDELANAVENLQLSEANLASALEDTKEQLREKTAAHQTLVTQHGLLQEQWQATELGLRQGQSSLESKLQHQIEETSEWKDRCGATEKDLALSKQQAQTLGAQLSELSTANLAQSSSLSDTRIRLEETQRDLGQERLAHERAKDACDAKAEMVQGLKEELVQMNAFREELERKFGSAMDEKESAVESLEGAVGEKEKECVALQDRLEQESHARETMQMEHTSARKAWDDRQSELEHQIRELEIEYDGAQNDTQQLRSEISDLHSQLSSVNNQVAQLGDARESDRAQFEEERSDLERRLALAEDQANAHLAQVGNLEQEKENKARMLDSEIRTLHAKTDRQQNEIQRLNEELAREKYEHESKVVALRAEHERDVDSELAACMDDMKRNVAQSLLTDRIHEFEKKIALVSEERNELKRRLQLFFDQAAQLPEYLQAKLFNASDSQNVVHNW